MQRAARLLLLAGGTVLVATTAGCPRNPATGERQLILISQDREIALGRQYDQQVVTAFGLHPDSELQAYVQQLGAQLAAKSEQPDLPWTFRVVDDPVVNAFALPGGFIYVSRGILSHFTSEAELTAVLGHEIGHVTGRHSAEQMSRQQLAGIGLGVGSILSPEVAEYAGLASAGLGVLFLKFGRDDERQADDLGLRYMSRANYDPRQMIGVFQMLGRVSQHSGGGRAPEWLSTHPAPEDREQRIRAAVATLERQGTNLDGMTVNRDGYLRRIDGLIFGQNPREGFFRDLTFLHPDFAFRFTFPQGWQTSNQRQAVIGVSGQKDAMLQISLAEQATPAAAADAFFAQNGVRRGTAWRREINGLATVSAEFSAATEQATLRGLAAFVSHQGHVFQLLGYATSAAWPSRQGVVATALASFERLTDPAVLNVQPQRIGLITLSQALSPATFKDRHGSPVSPEVLALINGVDPAGMIPAGLVKVVTGTALP